MVTEGIVLGHMIYVAGLEVDQAKVSIIRNLMPPIIVKGIRSFLGHAGFYRRFTEISQKLLNHYADCWKRILSSILMNPARILSKKSNPD